MTETLRYSEGKSSGCDPSRYGDGSWFEEQCMPGLEKVIGWRVGLMKWLIQFLFDTREIANWFLFRYSLSMMEEIPRNSGCKVFRRDLVFAKQ